MQPDELGRFGFNVQVHSIHWLVGWLVVFFFVKFGFISAVIVVVVVVVAAAAVVAVAVAVAVAATAVSVVVVVAAVDNSSIGL